MDSSPVSFPGCCRAFELLAISRRRFPRNFGNDYRYPRTSPRYGNFQLVCSRDYIMPSPVVVGRAIWKLATTEYGHVLITLGRLLGAMLFSAVAGILLGLVMGVSATMRPFIRALVVID